MKRGKLIGRLFGIALVCLVVTQLLGSLPVTAQPTFTGDVEADFTGSGVLIIPDSVGDVGLPLNALPGTVSGMDMADLRLAYDAAADTLYVGINTYGIAGDADGDGNPGGTSAWLAKNQGVDNANLDSTETIAVYFDLNQDGTFDVIAGVSASTDITGFTVANFSGNPFSPGFAFGTPLPSHTGSYYANPSADAPDFEFTILNFSDLPGPGASVGGFIVWAYMASLEDNGIGEDYIKYKQSPSTITTIVPSVTKVVTGGSVNLTVTEANIGSVNLTNPQVAITKDGAPFTTLEWPPATGDVADPGVLNVGETWNWTINLVLITTTTTFVATGSGITPGDFLVTYPGDLQERDDVIVNTDHVNKLRVLLPWIALGATIIAGASVLVIRRRRRSRA
jgi:hypothetical protein